MRKGFTLIELIFAIVIIGVLAAVAVPKFTNLKQNAEVNNIIKMVKDAESSVPSAAVNMSDLENNTTYTLNDILNISGAGITYTDRSGNNDTYSIKENGGTNNIAVLTFNRANRTLGVVVDCASFKDTASKDSCKERLNGTSATSYSYSQTVSF